MKNAPEMTLCFCELLSKMRSVEGRRRHQTFACEACAQVPSTEGLAA